MCGQTVVEETGQWDESVHGAKLLRQGGSGVLMLFRVFPQRCSAGPLPPGRERPCLITKCTQPLANHCLHLLFVLALCVIAGIVSVYNRKSTVSTSNSGLEAVRVRAGYFEMTTTHLGS